MEDTCQVFVVGDSLFAETLSQMLASSGTVVIIGAASSPEEALPLMATARPDVVIVADTGENDRRTFDHLLAAHPDLPIIRADLSRDYVQVITSQLVGARRSDLLAAIAALPKRN
jgi:DNA-binding NarL/FixJ family response regulator